MVSTKETSNSTMGKLGKIMIMQIIIKNEKSDKVIERPFQGRQAAGWAPLKARDLTRLSRVSNVGM